MQEGGREKVTSLRISFEAHQAHEFPLWVYFTPFAAFPHLSQITDHKNAIWEINVWNEMNGKTES